MLIRATLTGEDRDTTGWLVFDTGAGFLGLGTDVARTRGVMDRAVAPGAVGLADRPLKRLTLGSLKIDQVSPMLVLDVRPVRQVTDRSVLGLAGTQVLTDRAAWIDYRSRRLVVLPSPSADRTDSMPAGTGPPDRVARSRAVLGDLLQSSAIPLAFAIEGDGKILLRAFPGSTPPREPESWLTLILDTGATKTVFFESELEKRIPDHARWRSASGLSAPTLLGNAAAKLTLVPRLTLGGYREHAPPSADAAASAVDASPSNVSEADTVTVSRADVDCVVLESELHGVLARAIGRPVGGLLGYSFLRHYRLGLDFGNRIAWFQPYEVAWNPRPYEYVNVGIQLERRGGAIEVSGVVHGSPAERARIATGDRLIAIDGVSVEKLSVLRASRRLEGRAGTRVGLTVRRSGRLRTVSLVRRRIL